MTKVYMVFSAAGLLGLLDKHEYKSFKEQRDLDYFDIVKKDLEEVEEMLKYKDISSFFPVEVFDDMIMFPSEEVDFYEYASYETTRMMMRTGDSIRNIINFMEFKDPTEESIVKIALGTTLNLFALMSDDGEYIDEDQEDEFNNRQLAINYLQNYGYKKKVG